LVWMGIIFAGNSHLFLNIYKSIFYYYINAVFSI
jgi:hypothetical protein